MALLIIGLLAFGKYTHQLDPGSGLYIKLIQLHKSFGITVLLLACLRVVWRSAHTPPAISPPPPVWLRVTATLVHSLLYVLMFAIPLAGWVMVSASTLNVDTLLFGTIPWPHLPVLPTLDIGTRESIEHLAHTVHAIAGNVLIALLVLHIGAALKHHFIDKDSVLRNMLPDWSSRNWRTVFGASVFGVVAVLIGFLLHASTHRAEAIVAAGSAEVSFLANITDYQAPGIFSEASVTATLDDSDLANSRIEALVDTTSASSTDDGVDGGIRDPDWFDVETHPQARFVSTSISTSDTPNTFEVTGTLTIKTIELDVTFPMLISTEVDGRFASGEFTVDRRHFELGLESQPDEDWVGFDVLIRFRFPLNP